MTAQATAAVESKKKQKRKNMKMVCARDARHGRNDGLQFWVTLNWNQEKSNNDLFYHLREKLM